MRFPWRTILVVAFLILIVPAYGHEETTTYTCLEGYTFETEENACKITLPSQRYRRVQCPRDYRFVLRSLEALWCVPVAGGETLGSRFDPK